MVGGAGRDSFPEMAVLRLDDLVRVIAVMCEVTWSAELFARHGLHQRRFRRQIEGGHRRHKGRRPLGDRTAMSAVGASSILIGRP